MEAGNGRERVRPFFFRRGEKKEERKGSEKRKENRKENRIKSGRLGSLGRRSPALRRSG
jgi:hypothetical protein